MKHLLQLDGLRGVAVLIVVLGHLLTRDIGFGMVRLGFIPPLGVDLFFVLSGFLITNVLLRSTGKPHFFRNFYARRALRIVPLYAVLLIFTFGIANHRWASLSFDSQQIRWPLFALYLQNLYYHDISGLGPPALAVTWSLAIEEQFYTAWPILLAKLTTRNLSMVALALVLMAPAARMIIPHFGYDPYMNPLCRMDALAMGALLSLWIFHTEPSQSETRMRAVQLFAIGLAGEVAGHFGGFTHLVSKSFAALMFVAFLALALSFEPLCRSLRIAPLRFTGKLSYCLYLAHAIVGALVYSHFHGSSIRIKALRSLLILALSYGVAMLSSRFFEQPILGLKRYFSPDGSRHDESLSVPIVLPGSVILEPEIL